MNDASKGNVSTFARKEGHRIAYYQINSPTGAEFWDNHWSSNTSENILNFYRPYLKGYLGYGTLRHVFLKYLPRKGLILEAGCGRGQYVAALRSRGYNCIGVDFAEKTIEMVKKYLPDLPVKVGDVRELKLKDESLNGYISLGVVEHFKEGPSDALKEAFRTLKKEGILIISVPQAFLWRKKAAFPEESPLPENAMFYQYAFSPEEFRTLLEDAGFRIIAEYGYGTHFAFRIRFGWFRYLLKILPYIVYIDLIMDRTAIGRNLARMRLYVARKKEQI